ncbi:8-amino-7-oxononanoate synthase [Jatrophihabitans sp. GAS493]|uniref:8-amino-7-oxononanoate synthase n=1 Tax=Jatrophihabitans sp. GAS493 TaxID=1907575 RepID=UPI000BB997CF|nr:8-amino-7-oxononanoate synthase [Jatrophihabitans sp. GAS493]SOD75151.1 8-amino-7-oxononanoate synthase [Jatrophihabitans sp. GAS493]
MAVDPLTRLRESLAAREAAGLRRWLRPRPAEDAVLDLASNDYLGLARDKRVIDASVAALLRWGAGSTGSRLVTGTTQLHQDFEQELAEFAGAPAALCFSSGYLANLGVLTALGGPDVTIVSDATNHASLIDACRLSGSPIRVVSHADPLAVRAALTGVETEHVLVVTDAVFSVDGDLAPLRELHAETRARGGLLVVDEAHSLGVVGDGGTGAVVAAGLAAEPDVIRTVTLSKSLGAQGGAVLGAVEVIDLLISTARSFIFDTGLAPASVGAAQAALQVLREEPSLAASARANATALAAITGVHSLERVNPAAAVVPVFLGNSLRAVAAAQRCLEAGLRVGCFRPPSVPPGRACLRITARADLTEEDLQRVGTVLDGALR